MTSKRYFSSIYQDIKKTLEGVLVTISSEQSHEVLNRNSSVVAVGVNTESARPCVVPSAEWSNKTVTSLETDFIERCSHRRHEPSGEEHKDSRTDQRHKVKYPYNRRHSTGYR